MLKRCKAKFRSALILCALSAAPSLGGAQGDNLSGRIRSLLSQEYIHMSSLSQEALTSSAKDASSKRPPKNLYSKSYVDSQPFVTGGTQWQCLTEALYFEARGETVKGIFAVGQVILNRAASKRFPSSVCKVVHQGTGRRYACQFTYTCDGHPETISEPGAYRRMGKIAHLLLKGVSEDLTFGSTYYHTVAVSPSWSKVFERTVKIGSHLFYRRNVRTAKK